MNTPQIKSISKKILRSRLKLECERTLGMVNASAKCILQIHWMAFEMRNVTCILNSSHKKGISAVCKNSVGKILFVSVKTIVSIQRSSNVRWLIVKCAKTCEIYSIQDRLNWLVFPSTLSRVFCQRQWCILLMWYKNRMFFLCSCPFWKLEEFPNIIMP